MRVIRQLSTLIFLCAVALESSAQDTSPLTLKCPGQAEVMSTSNDDVSAYNRDKRKYESHTETHTATTPAPAVITLELTPAGGSFQGRVHLPANMIPPISSGGADGWWPLQNLTVTGDIVTAGYRLNGFNKPTLRLDRRTGDLSSDGLTHFSGNCTMASSQRLF